MSTDLLNLLIVDDDAMLANSVKLMAPAGFKVYIATKPELIPDHVFYHAAMVDMHILSKVGETPDGPSVIAQILKKNPQTEIVSMSGDLNRQNMEMAIKSGASRFLAKPLIAAEVTMILEKILAYWQLRQVDYANQKKTTLVGSSPAIEQVRKTIASLKGERSSVLIEGDTGTGKDVVARLLAQQEGAKPFVTINCAGIPENLFESEFFGHIKGSFTGADQNKVGLCEAANGGDLFLDEIEALPSSQQAKLLRFLETGEVKKVGAKEAFNVDVRVIAASNQPLKQMITEKKFREDLYFRISAHKISLPGLKDRKEDIPDVAKYFLDKEKAKRNKQFDNEAFEALQSYDWPGNIRELKRVCEQLVLTSPLPVVRKEDVNHLLFKTETPESGETIKPDQSLEEFINAQEKKFITLLLKQNNNIDQACQSLQISKSSLYKKIKDYGIVYE
ncbi:MAG: sigma-54 dependent transcriptional regulator [Pseudobdellovibrio sp.]|nr:sigma-54 dependent transcriptional regulator [Pseudobdellovibrio sp.]